MTPETERDISCTISLPAWMWDRLTEREKSLDREACNNLDLPDLSLSERVGLFLQMEIAGWYNRIGGRSEGNDLDDGLPF